MALSKLGRTGEANSIFEQLLQLGREMLATEPSVDFFAKFGFQQSQNVQQAQAHYLLGLGYAGLNDIRNARAEFSKAQQLDINHLWAKSMLPGYR
ncbi:MAG: hypothetical protein JSW54_10400 [Fidelibacterota bacterium]|nr:MAG: hypothetical protein JSW54_10400 [Candidatus Neomarinimicrobiota bacterium]